MSKLKRIKLKSQDPVEIVKVRDTIDDRNNDDAEEEGTRQLLNGGVEGKEGDKTPPPDDCKRQLLSSSKQVTELVLQTERDLLARNSLPEKSFKVLSWNVNGLNGILNGKAAQINGNKGSNVLQQLVQEEGNVDIIFLQETKLQDAKCAAFEDVLPGYVAHWSCSKTKKGYAGVAAFVHEKYVKRCINSSDANKGSSRGKQATLASFFPTKGKETEPTKGAEGRIAAMKTAACKSASMASSCSIKDKEIEDGDRSVEALQVLSVRRGCDGEDDEDEEGRVLTLEFGSFWVVGVYVTNSGMKLERLEYRLKQWNPSFQAYLARLNAVKPALVVGDMNVAPEASDVYNAGAKHLAKVPGLTPEEREAHAAWLRTGWKDTFRALHPDARGAYTYWNVKTRARAENKGLRLDLAVIGAADMDGGRGVRVRDSFILHEATIGFSDHAPIGVVLDLGA